MPREIRTYDPTVRVEHSIMMVKLSTMRYGACYTKWRNEKNMQDFGSQILKESDQLGDAEKLNFREICYKGRPMNWMLLGQGRSQGLVLVKTFTNN